MTRAYCIWCETGDGQPKPDMFWIHIDCFHKLSDFLDDFKSVKKRLEEGESTEEISRFLNRMRDFNERWDKTIKIIEKVRG